VRALAALTDGATRWTEKFRQGDWAALFDVVEKEGARALVDQVRRLEAADREERAFLGRSKTQDDATVVFADLSAPREVTSP